MHVCALKCEYCVIVSVCLYVCMYVCIYIYVCMYVCMHTVTYVQGNMTGHVFVSTEEIKQLVQLCISLHALVYSVYAVVLHLHMQLALLSNILVVAHTLPRSLHTVILVRTFSHSSPAASTEIFKKI